MNPETWVASGHVGGFSDPLIDCKECKTRHRADKLIEEWAHDQGKDMIADGMTDEQLINFINENKIPCPNCGKTNFTDIRKFNLMFKTFQGVTEDKATEVYTKLSKKFMCDYDEAGSIGKRYRREDEIGTPYCVTIDFDTLEDNCVTIRDRDSMEQARVSIDELENWIAEKVEF